MTGATLSFPHTPSWYAQEPLPCLCASDYGIFTVLIYFECNFCYRCHKSHFISLLLPSVISSDFLCIWKYGFCYCLKRHISGAYLGSLFCHVFIYFPVIDSVSPFLCSYVLLFREIFHFLNLVEVSHYAIYMHT
jgi:hypothetical protein